MELLVVSYLFSRLYSLSEANDVQFALYCTQIIEQLLP
jgi:hypothetical protein